jgi:hypothetical protein
MPPRHGADKGRRMWVGGEPDGLAESLRVVRQSGTRSACYGSQWWR